MKPEIISIIFSYFVNINICWPVTLNGSFTKHDFVTCFISHLENTDALSFSHLPSINVLTLSKLNWHINIFSRNHIYSFIIIYHLSLLFIIYLFIQEISLLPPVFIRKLFNILGSCQAHRNRYVFSRILIFS